MVVLKPLKSLKLCAIILICTFSFCGSCYLEAKNESKSQSIEVIASNTTRNLEASSFTYASTYFHPEDEVIFTAKISENEGSRKGPLTYIWYIPGTPAQKSEKPEFRWTVPSSLGEKMLHLIVLDEKGHATGTNFKLFIGCFEAPRLNLVEGVSRPGQPVTLQTTVTPCKYAVVKPGSIHHYTWRLKNQDSVVQEILSNTSKVNIKLPDSPGVVSVSVFAVDENNNLSPEESLDITVKPW